MRNLFRFETILLPSTAFNEHLSENQDWFTICTQNIYALTFKNAL